MNQQKKKLLIVDDEEALLFAFKDTLSEPDVEIDTAQSLSDLPRYLHAAPYNGAVVDLRLSGSDGFEGFDAIRMIKKTNPWCRVILLTAYAKPGTCAEAFEVGADFFIEKPVSPEKIKNIFKSLGVL